MKKTKNCIKALVLSATIAFATTATFAQTSKDTVKLGHGNDPMNVNPGKANDGMAVKPGESHDGMSVMSDTSFLSKNIMDNRMEIQLAKIGQQKGTDPATKKVAAQMISDHTALLQELEKLASAKPGVSSKSKAADMPTSNFPDGKEFDAAWAGQMLTMHDAKIAELERFLSLTKDPALKSVVLKALPKIKGHRELLLQIPGAKGKSGTSQII
jgi:predicted outer membrane protein